jgi:hypothetical protein
MIGSGEGGWNDTRGGCRGWKWRSKGRMKVSDGRRGANGMDRGRVGEVDRSEEADGFSSVFSSVFSSGFSLVSREGKFTFQFAFQFHVKFSF